MRRGKETCRILKEIRRQIADANDIEYITSECRFQGDCLGTCPKCEAEVQYLEQQLSARHAAGKAIALAGISAGLLFSSATSFTSESQEIKQSQSVQSSSCDKVYPIVGEVDPIYYRIHKKLTYYFTSLFSTPPECYNAIKGSLLAKISINDNGRIETVEIKESNLLPLIENEVINTFKELPPLKTKDNTPLIKQFTIPISFDIPQRLFISPLDTDVNSNTVIVSGNIKHLTDKVDLIGVTIVETDNNASNGLETNITETDFDGNFSIKVKRGSKIKISYVGLSSIIFVANENCSVQAYLEDDDVDWILNGEVPLKYIII